MDGTTAREKVVLRVICSKQQLKRNRKWLALGLGIPEHLGLGLDERVRYQ